jgi:hypothetical protein
VYKPRKLHEPGGWAWTGEYCTRCGVVLPSADDCLTDAELEEREKWREEAKKAGRLMERLRRKLVW